MGPRKPGENTAEYANDLATANPQLRAFTASPTFTPGQNLDPDTQAALNYLHDIGSHADQNAQGLELYTKSMLDHQTMLRQAPGREGTILTGPGLNPSTNFNPTSIL